MNDVQSRRGARAKIAVAAGIGQSGWSHAIRKGAFGSFIRTLNESSVAKRYTNMRFVYTSPPFFHSAHAVNSYGGLDQISETMGD